MINSSVEIAPIELGATNPVGTWVEFVMRQHVKEQEHAHQIFYSRNHGLAWELETGSNRQTIGTEVSSDKKIASPNPDLIQEKMGQADTRYSKLISAGVDVRSGSHAVKILQQDRGHSTRNIGWVKTVKPHGKRSAFGFGDVNPAHDKKEAQSHVERSKDQSRNGQSINGFGQQQYLN